MWRPQPRMMWRSDGPRLPRRDQGMGKVTFIFVGAVREPWYAEAAAEYRNRLESVCGIEVIELPEQPLPRRPTLGQIGSALDREYDAILSKLPPGARVAALCEEGSIATSQELYWLLGSWTAHRVSDIVFVAGSAHGLSPRMKAQADARLSLSGMTLPPSLARLVLLEQLCQAFQSLG